jgi:hypothetical protein
VITVEVLEAENVRSVFKGRKVENATENFGRAVRVASKEAAKTCVMTPL